jgi:hypothetical protein
MKPLTVDFIKKQGFKLFDETHEDWGFYQDFTSPFLEYALTIFFNYFKCGKVTYEVEMDGYELVNVGEEELLTLIKILPKCTLEKYQN